MSYNMKKTFKKISLFFMTLLFTLYIVQPQIYINNKYGKNEFKASPYVSSTNKHGKFNIHVVDANRNGLANVKLRLWEYYKDGTVYKIDMVKDQNLYLEVTSNINGYVSFQFDKLPGGTDLYYVELINAPQGYQVSPYDLVSKNGGDPFVTQTGDFYGPYNLNYWGSLKEDPQDLSPRPMTNHNNVVLNNSAQILVDIQRSNLFFKKINAETKEPIEGVNFQINKTSNASVGFTNRQYLTGTNGIMEIQDLSIGSYELVESNQSGYLNSSKITFNVNQTVNSNTFQTNLNITDIKFSDGTPLEKQSYTDSFGLHDLFIIPNEPSTLRIQKKDDLGNNMATELTLKKSTGEIIPSTSPAGTIGLYYFNKLSPGDYYLSESKVPTGFKTPPEKWLVQVLNDGTIKVQDDPTYIKKDVDANNRVIYNITNYELTTDLYFTNVDKNTGQGIGGVTFTLTKFNDSNFGTKTVVSSEMASSLREVIYNGLKVGKYELIQTIQKPGYLSQNIKTTFEVKLNLNGTAVYIDSLTSIGPYNTSVESPLTQTSENYIYNNVRKDYSFFVTDNANPKGLPLKDSVFTITNKLDSKSYTVTSDQNGKVSLNMLSLNPGEYNIKEDRAPLGFQLIEESWSINVNQYGEIFMTPPIYDNTNPDKKYAFLGQSLDDTSGAIYTIVHVPLNYDFRFTKVDSKQFPLSNAEFTLTKVIQDSNGNYIADSSFQPLVYSSASNTGNVSFDNLLPGIYKLQETKTPVSYIPNGDVYDLFEVKLNLTKNILYPEFVSGYKNLIQGSTDTDYKVVNSLDKFFKFTHYGYTGDSTGSPVTGLPTTNNAIPLPSVEFKIVEKGNSTATPQYSVSGPNGVVTFPDAVENVEYTLSQVSVPTTHIPSTATYTVKFSNVNGTFTPTFSKDTTVGEDFLFKVNQSSTDLISVNRRNDIVIKLKKVGDPNMPSTTPIQNLPGLPGSIYQIFEYDGTAPVGDFIKGITNSDGIIEFKDFVLPNKTYVIYEVLSPINYKFMDSRYLYGIIHVDSSGLVTLDSQSVPSSYWDYNAQDKLLFVKNDFQSLKVSFKVGTDKDSTDGTFGIPLSDATFKMTRLEKDPVTGELVPTNDVFTATSKIINDTYDNSPQTYARVDFPIPDNYIPPHTATTDPYDPLYITYKIEQISSSPGYVKLAEPFNIIVDRQNSVQVEPNDLSKFSDRIPFDFYTMGFAVINEPIKEDLAFFTVDGNNFLRVLGQTEFRLYSKETDSLGTPIYDVTKKQTMQEALKFVDLKIGDYYLQQITTQGGYQLLLNPIKITVREVIENGVRTGRGEIVLDPADIQYIEYIDQTVDKVKN